ncbi:MAG: hypothetical protein U9R58_07300 [Chloroflexota bacterium]|nr:hypothetical protein [Chloroflexota bacterium]
MKDNINRIPIIVLTDREYYQPTRVYELLTRITQLGELRLVGRLDEEQLIDRMQDADVAVVRRDGMSRSMFSACPHLLGMIKMGAGYEQIDIAADHPLLTMPNVILTPHALGRSWEALGRVMGIIERSLEDILADRLPQYTLNPEVVRKPSPFSNKRNRKRNRSKNA